MTRPAMVTVVVPVLDSMRYLPVTVPTLLAAASRFDSVELIYVDNGSRDGSYEYLRGLGVPKIRVLRRERATIAAVRNYGAQHATGEYLSFLDADCLVSPDYFAMAVGALERTGSVATGCEVNLPAQPHWIEATWHDLHYVGQNRFVHYLNSANFFITRAAFTAVGGFDENLLTGEDAEIGKRLGEAGLQLYECTAVDAAHLGNPRSVRQFYRRTVWHALGMFATVGWRRFDKPTMMTGVHLLASVAGVGIAATLATVGTGLLWFLGLQLLGPALTVGFRYHQTRRIHRPAAALFLYWLYYWARLNALGVILLGRAGLYRK